MHVGVFLCFAPMIRAIPWSSPCTWGCFSLEYAYYERDPVFPMHVGVFPGVENETFYRQRLPHARGGVSFQTPLPR